ncbi:hypothetical protein OEZ85_013416 [Tetradesmus obliquus]|uniref:Uncharacterized protein n=1 Tax=Tetradesmus obliquus TaxID=3088 RepID=A0ABY8U5P3_TETOB|nr:hypothetical protein OEZ85_013416 [Tetradesmus obliquus]
MGFTTRERHLVVLLLLAAAPYCFASAASQQQASTPQAAQPRFQPPEVPAALESAKQLQLGVLLLAEAPHLLEGVLGSISAAAGAVLQMQVPKGYAAMCEWRPDLGSCWVGSAYLLSVSGKPMSFASKLVSAAAARDAACAALANPIACTEASTGPLLCSWAISSGPGGLERGCRSTYLAEWDAFAAQVQRGSNAAVAAQAMGHAGPFMCPGSVGARSLSCSNIYPMDAKGSYIPGICQQGTGCAYEPTHHACTASKPLTQLISEVDPRIVGTCSAACYMRMLGQCSKAAQQPAAARKAWCDKQQGCAWSDSSNACKPDVWLSKLDQWGQQVAAAAAACGGWRSEAACAAAGVAGALKLQPARAAEWLKQEIGTGSASVKCPV